MACGELHIGSPQRGKVGADQMVCYTFNLAAAEESLPSSMMAAPLRLTFRVQALLDPTSGRPLGDPDLYLSHGDEALMSGGISRTRYGWKSANIGPDRIDIAPDVAARDWRAPGGSRTWVVGVLGYEAAVTVFELTVELVPAAPIVRIRANAPPLRFVVAKRKTFKRHSKAASLQQAEQLPSRRYFSLEIDRERLIRGARLTLTIAALVAKRSEQQLQLQMLELDESLEPEPVLVAADTRLSYGRGVYVPPSHVQLSGGGAFTPPHHHSPTSLRAFLSDSIVEPWEGECDWSAAPRRGAIEIVVECDEWKSRSRNLFLCVETMSCVAAEEEDDETLVVGALGALEAMELLRPPRPPRPSSFPPPCVPPPLGAGASLPPLPTSASAAPASTPLPTSASTASAVPFVISVALTTFAEVLTPRRHAALHCFDAIFANTLSSAAATSQRERGRCGLAGSPTFTYGEVKFVSFTDVLAFATPRRGETFLDVGCGAGKCLIAAALSGFGFGKCIGVEMLPGLVGDAKAALVRLRKMQQQCSSALPFVGATSSGAANAAAVGVGERHEETETETEAETEAEAASLAERAVVLSEASRCDVEVRCASFLADDGDCLSSADVVYASSICFEDAVLEALGKRARAMRVGSRFVTLKRFGAEEERRGGWVLMHQGWYSMSWGKTAVFVLRKEKEYSLITRT